MTRVEKINECIRYYYVNKGKSVREIQSELRLYGVELTLVELLTIVQGFNHKPVKERKKSKAQLRREEFKPVLEPLIRIASKQFITNKRLIDYMKLRGINHPSGGNFTPKKLDSLIADYGFTYSRYTYGGHKKQIDDIYELANLIEDSLSFEELNILKDWVNKHAKQATGITN